jgi:peptidoglycan-associated lipoprotein
VSSIVVEGHCDERGTAEYNMALGERRAQETKKYLVNLGIKEAIIRTVSFGEENPLDPASNEEAWAKNRRAHFVVAR